MSGSSISVILESEGISSEVKYISEKILNGKRISIDEGLVMYEQASLGLLGSLANFIREKRFGNKTFFNRNFHIEPRTNASSIVSSVRMQEIFSLLKMPGN